jgi:hypothetical protein
MATFRREPGSGPPTAQVTTAAALRETPTRRDENRYVEYSNERGPNVEDRALRNAIERTHPLLLARGNQPPCLLVRCPQRNRYE